MGDFFELDFMDVETAKSGDAIAIRYEIEGQVRIHVTDGGYIEIGARLVAHIREYYGNPSYIHRVIVTHSDGDHANGLRTVLEEFDVGELWMLRPWEYADEIIDRFETYTSSARLRTRLRAIYSNLAALEEIALRKKIPIREPFQGERIGAFTVLAPSKMRYLNLIVESERTPEAAEEERASYAAQVGTVLEKAVARVVNFVRAVWGEEVFSPNETSAENEMSVVQYAKICGDRILLTGDVGRSGLAEAADYAPNVGLTLPGIDKFQVPHHGSRRNVSTELLDQWLGERHANKPDRSTFQAIISSAKEDEDHPRKSVVRACIHRGAAVYTTEGRRLHVHKNAPDRGWGDATQVDYPDSQEE